MYKIHKYNFLKRKKKIYYRKKINKYVNILGNSINNKKIW